MKSPSTATASAESPLVEQLLAAAHELPPRERDGLLALISVAVSALGPDQPVPSSLRAVMQLIRRIRGTLQVGDSGVLFRGRPPWLTAELLAWFSAEAARLRSSAMRSPHYWFALGSAAVEQIGRTAPARSFVETLAGPVRDDVKVVFNYYEKPGEGVAPHIDRDSFTLILLTLLRHDHAGAPRSALYVYPPEGEPTRLELAPGDVVLLHAGSTVHQRTVLGPDEHVQTMSIGFRVRDFIPQIQWPD